ncbi:MAG: hypothetical protein ABI587_06885 [Gemmatimonadales bacterium]
MTTAAPMVPAGSAHLDLASAYEQVVEHEARKAVPVAERVTRWQQFGRPAISAAILLVAAWLWLLPPAWLTPTPDRAVIWPEGPAGTDLLLLNAADAIQLFRVHAGRLPQGGEVDSLIPNVALQTIPGGGFELQAPNGTTLTAPASAALLLLGYEIASPPGGPQQ